MVRVTRSLTLVSSLCAMLTACGGGQDPSQAKSDAQVERNLGSTNATRLDTTHTISDVSVRDAQIWAERAAINRAEVEQPTEAAVPPAGAAPDEKNAATATTKAITAPEASVYRFLNSQTGSHLYTRSVNERDTILNTLPQYRFEGPVFGAWQATTAGLFPVYRFANTANGTHFFTISETEKNNVLATAPYMHLEGPAYYASQTAQAGTTPLYRFYHLQKGFHFYTASASENQYIQANLSATYKYEGVGYYVNASIGNYDRALASFAGKTNAYGNVNAVGDQARFGNLRNMAFSPSGDLYVTDAESSQEGPSSSVGYVHRPQIRRVSAAGAVSPFVGSWTSSSHTDGAGSNATLGGNVAMVFDSSGTGYLGDSRTVRMVSPAGVVTTIAGSLSDADYVNGLNSAARFLGIRGITRDSLGNLYVSECYAATASPSTQIRKISTTGVVTTFAGAASRNTNNAGFADGQGTNARFNCPGQMDIDASDNLYVADEANNRIRKITPSGLVTTLAGQSASGAADGQGAAASFRRPYALAVDKATGDVYTSDWWGYTVRRITPAGNVTTVVGTANQNGVSFGSLPAGLSHVGGLAIRDNRLYIASLNGIYWTNLPQ